MANESREDHLRHRKFQNEQLQHQRNQHCIREATTERGAQSSTSRTEQRLSTKQTPSKATLSLFMSSSGIACRQHRKSCKAGWIST